MMKENKKKEKIIVCQGKCDHQPKMNPKTRKPMVTCNGCGRIVFGG